MPVVDAEITVIGEMMESLRHAPHLSEERVLRYLCDWWMDIGLRDIRKDRRFQRRSLPDAK